MLKDKTFNAVSQRVMIHRMGRGVIGWSVPIPSWYPQPLWKPGATQMSLGVHDRDHQAEWSVRGVVRKTRSHSKKDFVSDTGPLQVLQGVSFTVGDGELVAIVGPSGCGKVFNRSLPHTTVDYAYLWNANRVFGEDNPLPDKSDFRMDSHALRVEHTQWSFAKIEGYAYLLDFESKVSEHFSTATYGHRVQGSYEVYPKTSLLYTGEWAYQTDYGENPNDIAVNYYLGEIGAGYTLGGIWESASVKLSYEVLEGEGGIESFQTPLATPHPFHGYSDRFVVTPGDGLKDLFVSRAPSSGIPSCIFR